MHRTGRYSADAKWIVKYQGSGMRFAKVEALWNLHSNHEIASQEDIDQVYFDMRQRNCKSAILEFTILQKIAYSTPSLHRNQHNCTEKQPIEQPTK
jgi:hypothetical protein